MFKKGNKLYGIANNKCPRCHEGDFYVDKNPFHLSKILTINEKCSDCDLKYMLEPSFYHGAMYVSYGLSVATAIITFIITKLIIGLSLVASFITVVTSLIVLTPVMLKLSRLLYINMFVSFESTKEKKQKSNKLKN